jgi:protease-4
MKQFLLTMAGVFAGLMLFFIGVPILLLVSLANSAKPAATPADAVLNLDLRETLADQDTQNPLAFLSGRSLSVISVVETLHRAETDNRVKGLLIRLPEGGMSPAAADELRLAVLSFRGHGKPVLAHSQGIYAEGVSTASYMLGAASSAFWMQPGSALQSVGIASSDTFLKRFFDKWQIHADYQQRYEYKNAVNPYLYSDYTPAHREAELGWMTSVYQSELAQAAADRKQNPARLRVTLEAGPYAAEDAAARGLIDRVGQVEEAQAAIRKQAGGAELIDFASYRSDAPKTAAFGGDSIAVIGAEGEIVTGTSRNGGLNGQTGVYSDDVAQAFHEAIDDKAVKAIVFRVSSPGGSDTASEQILAGVRAARAAGKPVVVSMGTYAASGGYWISSEATEIVAEPTTLTGSIGVFGGKFALADALGHFGIDQRSLGVGGDFASAFSSGQQFTPSQTAQISAWMDHIYAGFVQRVAVGRKLSPDRVREIAKGRVWTGEQARRLGLVDGLGGFYDAVREAKRLAGLPPDQRVILKTLPARKSMFDAFSHALGVSSASLKAVAASAWLLGDPRAQGLMDQLAHARLGPDGSTVLAPTPIR